MTLGELIEHLEREDPDRVVPLGFTHAHSYRGYYGDLAFEPCEHTTVGAMLAEVRGALGQTFTGYKGGEYTMGEYTDVWLAEWGRTGEGLGPILLAYMLGKEPRP